MAENEFKETYEHFKHRFFDLTKVSFWSGQEEGNVFPLPGDLLKHRFLDLKTVAFWFGSVGRK